MVTIWFHLATCYVKFDIKALVGLRRWQDTVSGPVAARRALLRLFDYLPHTWRFASLI